MPFAQQSFRADSWAEAINRAADAGDQPLRAAHILKPPALPGDIYMSMQ
jgi:hypothetical protein